MIICSSAWGRTSKVAVNSLFIWAPSVGACAFLLPVYFSFHLVICFSDALMSGILNEVAVLEDPSLRSLVPDRLDLQMGSRASSTVTNTSRAG